MRLIVALAIVFASIDADAYPQFLMHNGDDRCGQCHVPWSGGGLLADYGRDESSSTISRGGDGRVLHGAWTPPSWFAFGGDFRFAVGDKQVEGINDVLIFPMQMDLNTRFMKDKFAFALTVGMRGSGARDEPMPKPYELLISREHYVAYAGETYSFRAGRFFPIYGLRMPDHTAFVRRYLGMGLYEEPYAVEVTRDGDRSELHATLYAPNPLAMWKAGQQGYGGALVFERRYDKVLLGAQTRATLTSEDTRIAVGGTAKYWMPEAKLLWLAELDLQRQVLPYDNPGRNQLAGYLGATRWLTRGLLLGGALHLWDPDLAVQRTSRTAAETTLQYFPRSHFEVSLLVRGTLVGTNADAPGFLSLLQVHYYL